MRNQSGAALGAKHQIRTTYADVKLGWPASAGVKFDLESTYGSVRSDLPGKRGESGSRQTLRGTSGDRRASVTLVAESGSVTLSTE